MPWQRADVGVEDKIEMESGNFLQCFPYFSGVGDSHLAIFSLFHPLSTLGSLPVHTDRKSKIHFWQIVPLSMRLPFYDHFLSLLCNPVRTPAVKSPHNYQ